MDEEKKRCTMPNDYQKIRISASLSVTGIFFGLLIVLAFFSGCMQQTGVPGNSAANVSDHRVVATDILGNRIELDHPAKRIITVGKSIQMLILIGSGDRIVGIDQHAMESPARKDIRENLRPDVKSIGNTGNGGYVSLETISQMDPDVYIAYHYSLPGNVEKYRVLNLTVFFFKCQGIETLNEEAYQFGELTGNPEGAQRYIQFNRKYQDLVESRLANLTPDEMVTVYGESEEYLGVTREENTGQIIAALHGKNVYGNQTDIESPRVSSEWLVAQDPDVIIKVEGWDGWDVAYNFSSTHERITNRAGYDHLKAVKTKRVYIINKEITETPHAVIGLVHLAKALYPDRFADIDPEAVRQEYIREFHVPNYTADWFYPPFSSGTLSEERMTTSSMH